MRKSFEAIFQPRLVSGGPGFWLRVLAGVLLLLNLAVLYLVIAPPGGSRGQLEAESEQLRSQIASTRARSLRLGQVAAKVQVGGEQSSQFQTKYILPKRTAYERLIIELQRITKASGMQERDAVYSEEPIEGTADLTLLTSAANYEGSYQNLRKFLLELDHSPVLVMLENLQAAPQQKGSQISASMRFQTIFQEEPAALASTERAGQAERPNQ